jgi:hypothetical protein
VIVAAVFLAVLGGAISRLIGFKPPKEPTIITRDLRTARATRGEDAKTPRAGN